MIEINIEKNDGEQRLDKFLKKYLKRASLSHIYKLIRKDIKVNNKRAKADTIIKEGDVLKLYIEEDQLEGLKRNRENHKTAKQFNIAYEDKDMIVVEKPYGLLTHGDSKEKKNTLANQVLGYLIEKREYNPRIEKTFVPSPVNRLDRNTTGLVIFGKNAEALKKLNRQIRLRDSIKKYYLTIVSGELKETLILKDSMMKNQELNTVKIVEDENGKVMETIARPLKVNNGYTLVEVELLTGRTHQIRVHLADAGYPIIGDKKYGNAKINFKVEKKYKQTTQLLHAYKLTIEDKDIVARMPVNFENIAKDIFD